jgi:hypothetical protein
VASCRDQDAARLGYRVSAEVAICPNDARVECDGTDAPAGRQRTMSHADSWSPAPGSYLEDLRARLRLAYVEGAESWTREKVGRGLTRDELRRVTARYPGREERRARGLGGASNDRDVRRRDPILGEPLDNAPVGPLRERGWRAALSMSPVRADVGLIAWDVVLIVRQQLGRAQAADQDDAPDGPNAAPSAHAKNGIPDGSCRWKHPRNEAGDRGRTMPGTARSLARPGGLRNDRSPN